MAQEINVISKDKSASPSKRYPPVLIQARSHRSIHSKPYSDIEALVKVAYKNGVATFDWKEAGLVLRAERDEDGNLVIKKSKHR
jgi:hypothetical protein